MPECVRFPGTIPGPNQVNSRCVSSGKAPQDATEVFFDLRSVSHERKKVLVRRRLKWPFDQSQMLGT